MTQPLILKSPDTPGERNLTALAREASSLGREIVEISGTLDAIGAESEAQVRALSDLRGMAERIIGSNKAVEGQAGAVQARAATSIETIGTLVEDVRRAASAMQDLAGWVETLAGRVEEVEEMLTDVRKSNDMIGAIAAQVSILAINAKIEAARAGDAGRGFAVVAEAVNDLSKKTKGAASEITTQIELLTEWIGQLSGEAQTYGKVADDVQSAAQDTDQAMDDMRRHVSEIQQEAEGIGEQAQKVRAAGEGFGPALARIGEGARDTGHRIEETRGRLHPLIDSSERMVQGTVTSGGTIDDQKFIDRVTADAVALGARLERAIDAGAITLDALFDQRYASIPGTDPEQFMAPYTELTDRLFPEIQEAALDLDPRVVFCAAVDLNGYLPTHNRKFSHPQGRDPVKNAAQSRNRRLFNDRVGLKAGRNTEPFLLQVYRRDMGGGDFRMMKDLSAPIMVKGRHWGGLRLAYTF